MGAGGKACADDAKVRAKAKATAINLNIAPFVVDVSGAPPTARLGGSRWREEFYIVFGRAE